MDGWMDRKREMGRLTGRGDKRTRREREGRERERKRKMHT